MKNRICNILGIAGYDLVAIFPIGYADPAAKPAPLHTLRKSASELVSQL